MKGFVITLDSAVALLFVLVALILISSQSISPKVPGNIYLKQLSLDVVKVLEKTGRIEGALLGNASAVNEVIEATPKLSCFEIQIINATGTTLQTFEKSECGQKTNLDIQIVTTSAYIGQRQYIIRSESWLRKED
jgi:hypothetical protein